MLFAIFAQILHDEGGYSTPADNRPPGLSRSLGRFDWWLYGRVGGIVFRGGILAALGRYGERAWGQSSCDTFQVFEDCGARLAIAGTRHLRGLSGPAVIVSNHMSMAETFLLPALVLPFGSVHIVVKRSLLRYPFFGTILKATAPIAVTRRNPREDLKTVLREGQERLADGASVIAFPQATRSTRFDPTAFNTIGAKLARRAGVPLVPLALKTDFQGLGKVLKDVGPIDRGKTLHFEFGEPIVIGDNERDAHRRAVNFISERLRSWGGHVAGDGDSPDDT